MSYRIELLPGDGIGPEVTAQAKRVLCQAATAAGIELELHESPIGGAAIDACGDPLPPDTLARCRDCDAVFLGAVGGPKWSDPKATARPEQGLLQLRSELDLFANLRPVMTFPALREQAPLRAELLEAVDILFVRELVSGIYFGPRQEQGDHDFAFDTMRYSVDEVTRVAHVAFRAATARRRKVTSVDKANVLASMRLWRSTVEAVAREYPAVTLEHQLVDAMAMHLMTRPATFDVVLAGNMFGDILSDEASVLAGSLGMLPSASLGVSHQGLYEPVHGSAPDIAGQGIANPLGAILSVALLLRHSLEQGAAADHIEQAVRETLASGQRTADLGGRDSFRVTTREMAEAVMSRLSSA